MERVRIEFDDGALVYDSKGRWQPEGWVSPEVLDAAREIAGRYRYSVADGQPGCKLAAMIARETGGKVILPPVPPDLPGVVY